MTVPPTDWRSLGDLAALVDPDAVVAMCARLGMPVDAVEPDYLRIKLGESATVGYSATVRQQGVPDLGEDGVEGDGAGIGATRTEPLHVRTFADADRAASLAAKWADRHHPGLGIGASTSSVVFGFPNDSEIRGLRHAVQPRGWRRLLRESVSPAGESLSLECDDVEIVRYKPGRRVVGRVSLRDHRSDDEVSGFFRYLGTPTAGRLVSTAARLHRAGVPVAAPIASGYGGHLLVERRLPGIAGSAAIGSGDLDLDEVLRTLRRLHSAHDGAPLGADDAPRLDADAALAEARAAVDAIAALVPSLAEAALRVAVGLRGVDGVPRRLTLLHGDVHLDQFLIDGRQVSIVDLERSATGAPGYDIGCLAGHLVELRCRAGHHPPTADIVDDLRHRWAEAGGEADDVHPVFVATGLVRRALLAVRSFDRRLPDVGESLLHAAATVLGTPRFVTLHPRPKGEWTAVIRVNEQTAAAVVDDDGVRVVDPTTDRRLTGLPHALRRGRLVAYRPERRAVVAADDGSYLKVTPPTRSAALADRHRLVSECLAGLPDLRSPAVLAHDAEHGIVELEGMAGTSLHDVLLHGTAADRHRALERAGAVLTALASVDPAAHWPGDGGGPPVSGDGGRAEHWLQIAAGLHPGLAIAHRPVVDLLERAARPRESVHVTGAGLAHGDLHDKNLLLDADGAALIDLDSAGQGDPVADQGNLVAHVLLRALQRGDGIEVGRTEALLLADSLAPSPAASRSADHEASVRLHTARTLQRLAVVYRCRARWAHLSATLLDEAWRWAADATARLGTTGERT